MFLTRGTRTELHHRYDLIPLLTEAGIIRFPRPEKHLQAWLDLTAQQGSVQVTAGQSNRRAAVFAPQTPAGSVNEAEGNDEMRRY